MSDLISRVVYKSKLLKELGVLNKEYRKAILNEDNDLILAIQNQQSAYMIALRLLDNLPTAYDIDKVVEELEERKALNERLVDYESKNGTVTEKYQHIKAIDVLNEAIEIVKNGCISDDVCEYRITDKMIYASCNNKQIASAFCWFNECGDYKYCPYCGKKINVM